MSAFTALPWSLKLAGAIGALQTIGLAAYAVTIIGFEISASTSGIQGSDLAPTVLIGMYFVFAVMLGVVTFLLLDGRAAARTPFLVAQGFGVIIAQTLWEGDGLQLIAAVIGVASLVAGVVSVLPASRAALR